MIESVNLKLHFQLLTRVYASSFNHGLCKHIVATMLKQKRQETGIVWQWNVSPSLTHNCVLILDRIAYVVLLIGFSWNPLSRWMSQEPSRILTGFVPRDAKYPKANLCERLSWHFFLLISLARGQKKEMEKKLNPFLHQTLWQDIERTTTFNCETWADFFSHVSIVDYI